MTAQWQPPNVSEYKCSCPYNPYKGWRVSSDLRTWICEICGKQGTMEQITKWCYEYARAMQKAYSKHER